MQINIFVNMKRIGLVLSGGGVRGIAHLGVIKLLEELNVQISAISGTSAGAIVGAFIADGYRSDAILEIVKSRKFFGFSNLLFGKPGIFNMDGFEQVYNEYFPHNKLESLKIPLHIATTDMIKGESRYFSEGDLSLLLRATSCVPLVFQPIKYNGKVLMDGGILNNFPTEPLLGRMDMIIGVHVNSLSEKMEELHMKDLLDRSFHIAVRGTLRHKATDCAVFIEPPEMSRFGMFDFTRADEIFTFAYHHAAKYRNQIYELIDKNS